MKKLTIRCSDEEYEILVAYCLGKEQTQNDVLREQIRRLKRKKSRAEDTGLKTHFSG